MEIKIFSVAKSSVAACLVAGIFLTGTISCKKRSFNSAKQSSVVSGTPDWLPVAEWSGRMILPTLGERTPDHAVKFEVQNAPAASADLIGKTVWLRFSAEMAKQDWIEFVTRDIIFDKIANDALANGMVLPKRLDGWTRVGPLESMAGGRPLDDVQVMLKGTPHLKGDALEISAMPVYIFGTQTALVKFESPVLVKDTSHVEPTAWNVVHWDNTSKSFSGRREVVRIGRVDPVLGRAWKPASFENIQAATPNENGYYIFAEPGTSDATDESGFKILQALEPRALTWVRPPVTQNANKGLITDLKSAQKFVDSMAWDSTKDWEKKSPEQKRSAAIEVTMLEPNVNRAAVQGNVQKFLDDMYKVKSRYLVVHTWGAVTNTVDAKQGEAAVAGLTTGHYAFAFAEVVIDPFTQEKKFDIEYKQVYARGPEGLLSGSYKWHSYEGSLRWGHAFYRPVADAILRTDDLARTYHVGSANLVPLDFFDVELEAMMSRFRTGEGNGYSPVNQATSCVQNSSQSLYVALNRFQAAVKANGGNLTSSDKAEQSSYNRIEKLLAAVMHQITPVGARSDWKATVELKVVPQPDDNALLNTVRALKSFETILPRTVFDGYVKRVVDPEESGNGGALMLRSNVVGGEFKMLVPRQPLRFDQLVKFPF